MSETKLTAGMIAATFALAAGYPAYAQQKFPTKPIVFDETAAWFEQYL